MQQMFETNKTYAVIQIAIFILKDPPMEKYKGKLKFWGR